MAKSVTQIKQALTYSLLSSPHLIYTSVHVIFFVHARTYIQLFHHIQFFQFVLFFPFLFPLITYFLPFSSIDDSLLHFPPHCTQQLQRSIINVDTLYPCTPKLNLFFSSLILLDILNLGFFFRFRFSSDQSWNCIVFIIFRDFMEIQGVLSTRGNLDEFLFFIFLGDCGLRNCVRVSILCLHVQNMRRGPLPQHGGSQNWDFLENQWALEADSVFGLFIK